MDSVMSAGHSRSRWCKWCYLPDFVVSDGHVQKLGGLGGIAFLALWYLLDVHEVGGIGDRTFLTLWYLLEVSVGGIAFLTLWHLLDVHEVGGVGDMAFLTLWCLLDAQEVSGVTFLSF